MDINIGNTSKNISVGNVLKIKDKINLENITITPTNKTQTFNHPDSDGYDNIVVEPISEEYIKPEGTLDITENGKYDVTDKAEVDVNVGGFEINDANYLFYNNARTNQINEILSLCKKPAKMGYMFQNCTNITELDLTAIDTSEVSGMGYMFSGCSNLEQLNISNFNTSKVTQMFRMFENCKKLKKLDLSSFDTSKVTNTGNLVSGCTLLDTLIINNSKIFNLTTSSVLNNTPIANGTGYVYVPDDLVEKYKTTTNWSQYASQIKGISELPKED
jgi:surface protein